MQKFRTYQLALELHHLSKSVSLKAPYKDQFQRAVLSVALNLAEGSAKTSNQDRRRFYEIALGSLRETQAIIELLDLNEIKEKADEVGKNLFCLCRSLSHRH